MSGLKACSPDPLVPPTLTWDPPNLKLLTDHPQTWMRTYKLKLFHLSTDVDVYIKAGTANVLFLLFWYVGYAVIPKVAPYS